MNFFYELEDGLLSRVIVIDFLYVLSNCASFLYPVKLVYGSERANIASLLEQASVYLFLHTLLEHAHCRTVRLYTSLQLSDVFIVYLILLGSESDLLPYK